MPGAFTPAGMSGELASRELAAPRIFTTSEALLSYCPLPHQSPEAVECAWRRGWTIFSVTIAALERELETELARSDARWQYRIKAGKVRFGREVHAAHKRLKQSVPTFLRESSVSNMLTTPIIESLILPIALLDAWGHSLPGDLLSRGWHRAGVPLEVCRDRSSPPRVPERH